MEFIKMHGAGNDYIFINCTKDDIKNPEEFAKKASNRHFGIGSDGVILIKNSNVADVKMKMYNADGSEGKMCGNAIRCLGKYVYENKISSKKTLIVETLSGNKKLDLFVENEKVVLVSVDMGTVSFKSTDIEIHTEKEEFFGEKIFINDNEYNVYCASIGNPHMIIFSSIIKDLDLEKTGKYFENHEIFKNRVNTEFVNVINEKEIEMRVYERGSGETLACGTGACAVVAVCAKLGKVNFNEDITVKVLGGTLIVSITNDYNVTLKGDAVEVFHGYCK